MAISSQTYLSSSNSPNLILSSFKSDVRQRIKSQKGLKFISVLCPRLFPSTAVQHRPATSWPTVNLAVLEIQLRQSVWK